MSRVTVCRAIISAQTAQFKSREQNRPFTSSQSSRNDKVQCVHSNIAIFHAELGPDQSESRLDDRLHCKTEMEKNHVMFQMYVGRVSTDGDPIYNIAYV